MYVLNGNIFSFSTPPLNPIYSNFNEDYWFNGTTLYTTDGWIFQITKVKDYQIDGIVLGLHTYKKNDYPYRPINTFSPIDLFIGVDEIKNNPNKYPLRITSYADRTVHWIWGVIIGLTIII
ncbi:MAG: hypothetical protein KKC68_05230 [Candidatus Thermoplasmatota archaeon]|nr:hypothetical protein [Candidatus Thermoplasmatota archaeon]MBU1941157.1 hypothetical protein [Candidatus Thermoplasmatota archaeon]